MFPILPPEIAAVPPPLWGIIIAMVDLYEDARRYDALAEQHFGSRDAAYWKKRQRSAAARCWNLPAGADG